MPKTKKFIDEKEVLDNLKKAMENMSGDEIATLHNQVCCPIEIQYNGDGIWEYL